MEPLRPVGKIIARIILILVRIGILLTLVVFGVYFWSNKTNGSLESSGQRRTYLLYVPESYNPSMPTPLVLSFHGFAEWPAHQMQTSRWNALADQYGFLVVYPSGTRFPKRWVITSQPGSTASPEIDIQFISDLIDQLARDYNIDQSRIYANGLSNGGGMSTMLGCKLSERIAAVGSVAGAYLIAPEDCTPARPVPLIAFHGTADPIVPYQGGPSSSFHLPFPAVEEWIESWALRNGCDLPAEALPGGVQVNGIRYPGCAENAAVNFYSIQGGGHSWPGGEPLPEWIVGETNQEIDATELMWEFFSQYLLDLAETP